MKQIAITFNDNTSHTEVIMQLIDKLVKANFASREEIIDNMEEISTILYNDNECKDGKHFQYTIKD